eukprot:539740-Rhodomonas_salina.1
MQGHTRHQYWTCRDLYSGSSRKERRQKIKEKRKEKETQKKKKEKETDAGLASQLVQALAEGDGGHGAPERAVPQPAQPCQAHVRPMSAHVRPMSGPCQDIRHTQHGTTRASPMSGHKACDSQIRA